MEARIKIGETDIGHDLRGAIDDLKELLSAYKNGEIKENHKT